MGANTKELTDGEFDSQVLKSAGVSLVDFWAPWCGPCLQLGPKIEQVADQFAGKVSVYKMNVDDNPGTPGRYNVRGIPTVVVVKGGQAVDTIVGNQPKEVYVDALTRALA